MTKERVVMIALRPTYYGGDIKQGATFQVSPEHVELLTKLKAARRATLDTVEPEPDKKNAYKRRDMRAEK